MPLRSVSAAIIALMFPTCLPAQGFAHVHHAFDNVCNGFIYYDGLADSVVWSTGEVGPMLSDLVPGFYGFTAYLNGQVVDQGTREVELSAWNIIISGHPSFFPSLFEISGAVEVPNCVAQIFDGLCCEPDPAQTSITILQDGIPYPLIDVFSPGAAGESFGCVNVDCDFNQFLALLPYGHSYAVIVNDPTCAGIVTGDTAIIAHSCANLYVETQVVDATPGQANGSIALLEAIPDPNEPYPIQSPVSGTALLYLLPDETLIGFQTGVTSALWTGLASGDYRLVFGADQGCQPYVDTLHVGDATTIHPSRVSNGLSLFPTVTEGNAQLISDEAGPIELWVLDINGAVLVHELMPPGTLAVQGLAAGMYVLKARQGTSELIARFIRR
jgi:hypothetical protein